MQNISQTFDFHCHSLASDGSLSPKELICQAQASGIQHLALTDHDTIDGYLAERDKVENLQLVSGCEFSCEWSRMTLHIVALAFEPEEPSMQQLLARQKRAREQRSQRIAEKMEKKCGIQDAYDKAAQFSSGNPPSRPHFARVMVEEGIVSSPAQAFHKHLGAGKWGDIKLFWPPLEEVVDAVTTSRGVAVVAHPFHYKLTATKLRRLLDEFQSAGGIAAETAIPNTNAGQFGWMVDELHKRKMLQSGGSDFHGRSTPWCRLGHFPKLATGLPDVRTLIAGKY